MKIWQLRADLDNYSTFHATIPFTGVELSTFDGRSHYKDAKIRKVAKKDWREGMELGDAPNYIIPVFSGKAVCCLMPLIGKNVEVLRLEYEKEYYGINVTTVIDAMDYGKSKYISGIDGKDILSISEYSFLPEKVKNTPIFKISDERQGFPLITDEFKQIVESQNLEGFVFKLLWDSEKE